MGAVGTSSYHKFVDEADVKNVLGDDYSKWSKSFNQFEPTYKEGQWDSIGKYTQADYNKFNEDLRVGNELTDYGKKMVDDLDTSIARFNLSTPIEAYRQVRFSSKGEKPLIDKDGNLLIGQGQTITDKGFMSTTINRSIAGHMITNGNNENTYIMSIQIPKGKGVGALLGNASTRPYEEEFLLNRGASYKVIGKPYKDSVGYWVVPVRVVK